MNYFIRITVCIFLPLCTLLSSCNEQLEENYAIISGTLLNVQAKKVNLYSSVYNPIGSKSKTIRKQLIVDKKGCFIDTIYLKKSRDFVFMVDKSFVNIHLCLGGNLNISADANNLVSTVQYSGNSAPISNFLLEFDQLFKDHNKLYSQILKQNEQEFKKSQEGFKNSIYQLLNSTDGLKNEFIEQQKKDIEYSRISSYLNYYERHGKAIGNENYKVSPDFLNIINSVNMEDAEELKKSPRYGFLLKKYYTYEYSKTGDFYEDDKVKFIQFLVNTIKDPIVKEELLFLYGAQVITSTPNYKLCFDILLQNISNKEYVSVITEKYNQMNHTQAGHVSPLFVDYQNVNDGTNSLSDFKGKYVYIDVWATWCGPCKAEIPYLKEVEEKYHNKNIVFVSLSIDELRNIERWKKYVKDKELGGVQIIADNARESDFIAKYQIEGIPRFILIDPKGIIVNPDAPRPSDKKLIELFDELGI